MLVIAISVITLSLLLSVREDNLVEFVWLPGWPLPQSCTSRWLLQADCPGCGLTRSFIHFFHADWRSSLTSHRVGWILAIAVLAQIPYRLLAFRMAPRRPLGSKLPKMIGGTLIVLLILNWLLNVIQDQT